VTVLRRFWPLVAAVLLLAVAGFGAATGSLPLRPAPLGAPDEPPPTWDPHLATQEAAQEPVGEATRHIVIPAALITAVQAVCLLLVVAVIILLVVMLVRGAARRAAPTADPVVRPTHRDTTKEVMAAVDRGLVELDDGDADPRRAVIACWVRLERAAEAAGLPRKPGDTSTDLVVRLLGERSVNSAVLNDFAAVYREARYSPHRVDTTMRDEARAALRLLRDELGAASRPEVAS
jgi:hypothetical protein